MEVVPVTSRGQAGPPIQPSQGQVQGAGWQRARGRPLGRQAASPALGRLRMSRFLRGLKTDIHFIRSHTLQPGWYKHLKVLLLLGFLLAYLGLFGLRRTAIFVAAFLLLSLAVHLVYRTMTKTWTRSWLDFVVVQEGGAPVPRRIGLFYYSVVALNAASSVALSMLIK